MTSCGRSPAPLVEWAERFQAGVPTSIPDRPVLEALVYLIDSGCKRRQLPDRFGAWDAGGNRFCRWDAAGVFERLFTDLPPAGSPGSAERSST